MHLLGYLIGIYLKTFLLTFIMIKKLFAKGRRGLIYINYFKGKKVIIKEKNPSSLAEGRIKNEGDFLKKLNKYKIGPKLVRTGKNYVMYEFVKGDFILDFIEKKNKARIMKILKEVLEQCFILDELKINKLEMHHPVKHIIIDKKPVMIDFERTYYTENPKNVSQFCQFLMLISKLLKKKKMLVDKKKMIDLVKKYKEDYSEKKFKEILKFISSL